MRKYFDIIILYFLLLNDVCGEHFLSNSFQSLTHAFDQHQAGTKPDIKTVKSEKMCSVTAKVNGQSLESCEHLKISHSTWLLGMMMVTGPEYNVHSMMVIQCSLRHGDMPPGTAQYSRL